MKEKGYYYDDGKYCEIETGPSFEDFPGMAQVVSPIPLCDACKKSDFDENRDLTVCKAYGKMPKIIIVRISITQIMFGIWRLKIKLRKVRRKKNNKFEF